MYPENFRIGDFPIPNFNDAFSVIDVAPQKVVNTNAVGDASNGNTFRSVKYFNSPA